jgi:hypothetical protein
MLRERQSRNRILAWGWVVLWVGMLFVAAIQFSNGETAWGFIGVGVALGAAALAWSDWRQVR